MVVGERIAPRGMFQVWVRVANPYDSSRFFEEKFWVDTGALYTFVPEDRLAEIGITPLRTRELIPADGRRDKRLLGEAVLTVPVLEESLINFTYDEDDQVIDRWELPKKLPPAVAQLVQPGSDLTN